jgi:predicted glutamine amidotransferase
VVSEPLDADETSWTPVANGHVLIAANGAAPRVQAFRAN